MQKCHSMQVNVFQNSSLNIDAGFVEALDTAKREFDKYTVSAVLKEIKHTGYEFSKGSYVLIFTVSAEDID